MKKSLIKLNREPAGDGFQAHCLTNAAVWERADTWEEAAGMLAYRLGLVDLSKLMPPKEPGSDARNPNPRRSHYATQ